MYRSKKTMPLLAAALVIVALIASGCASLSAEPTPSLQELQSAAMTAAAQTLTAQAPKETPIPPTAIPPTPTLPPTFEPVVQEVVPQQVIVQPQQPQILPAATEEGTKEQDCSKAVIGAGTEGPRAPVSVVNKKGASITLSYYLEPSAFGQCGSGSLSINGDNKTLNLPVGCYWLYAWVTYDGKDQSFQGYGCNPKSGAVWTVYPDRVDAVENDK